jgi:tetratricopeptide (TPR) repeat protein
MAGDSTMLLDDRKVVYESFCTAVRVFIESSLVQDESAVTALKQALRTNGDNSGLRFAEYIEAEPQRPNQAQFAQIIQTKGVETAAEICRRFDLPKPEYTLLPEGNFNQLGYQYLQQGDASSARIIFGWCRQAYPASANACDSYADACLALGDTTAAIESLKKSLELLPADSTIEERFRAYILENTPRRISELTGEEN